MRALSAAAGPALVAAVVLALWQPAPAGAQATAGALRVGLTGSLGYLSGGADVVVGPNVVPMWSAGFGLELRLGVQATEWLALDVQLMAETLFFYGDARAGVLIEIAPHPMFAVAAGGGVGSMFMANLFYPSPSADFGSGVLRFELRFPGERADDLDIVVGVEGQLGATFAGAVPAGTLVGGARLFAGFLLR